MASRPLSAFTLIEMAIVLTIIALLVGAVTVGSKLLKQAELQTIVTNYTKYSGAYAQFKQQYGSFPGDMADATSFWPTATTNATDGNGDGAINSGNEPYQAWLHLSLAKMIDGNYSGSTPASIGVSVPKAKITNSGWSFFNNTSLANTGYWFGQDLGNMLAFGGPPVATTTLTQSPAITPSEAWQIDTKIDDGVPGTGRTLALKPSGGAGSPVPNCVIMGASDDLSTYNVTLQNVACSLNISLISK